MPKKSKLSSDFCVDGHCFCKVELVLANKDTWHAICCRCGWHVAVRVTLLD